MRRALPFLAAALVLTACAESTPGTPSAGSAPTTTASGSSQPSGSAKPSTSATPKKRPKTINIKDVDPCTLLAASARQQLGLDAEPKATRNDLYRSPACDVGRRDFKYSVQIVTVTTVGLNWYFDGSFDVEPTAAEIGGFPGVYATNAKNPFHCYAAIDVSDGQMVDVLASSLGQNLKPDQLCELARNAATEVVATLMK
ncbi:hypothetical protein GCM10022243_51610 [Saccharothrix violaceirubra]|uniref:DUF3558 domain-containing protein n=1 Tax=Saccharothrix violaceirubra TaxID=413306 RepID=A0A7W7TAH2_9PSEU|nr:DUF3558 domain-containing protein [Saccharothrix violaceirubra]MBB4969538.1 hypothetical protein [Saccharothrix violaceirubra]